jgi:hypothetical protein
VRLYHDEQTLWLDLSLIVGRHGSPVVSDPRSFLGFVSATDAGFPGPALSSLTLSFHLFDSFASCALATAQITTAAIMTQVRVPPDVVPAQVSFSANWKDSAATPNAQTMARVRSDDPTVFALLPGNSLYIPLSLPDITEDQSLGASNLYLVDKLAGLKENDPKEARLGLPFYCHGCGQNDAEGPPTLVDNPTIGPNITLYVPYVTNTLFIIPRVSEMSAHASELFVKKSSAPTASSTPEDKPGGNDETSGNGTSGNGACENGASGNGTSGNGTCENGASGNGTSGNGTSVNGTGKNDKGGSGSSGSGTIAGGVVGGFFAGVVIGVMLLWLLGRRRRQTHATSRSTRPDELMSSHASENKGMQNIATPMTVTGWQKHLPQEKDDGTIARTVKTVFEQVQVHVEGFYKKRPVNMNSEAVAAIERISSVDLAKKLSKAPNGVLMLEAILIRWIVHRISLRSIAAESFLPVECTKIPEQNGWHMESDEHGNGHAAEVKKGRSQSATFFLRHLY